MSDLIRQGKTLYWGTSEWPVARILAAHEAAAPHHLVSPLMEEPQYSMLVRDRFENESSNSMP
jgi:aryl-alcohol dehydrogenase-like predicted oxidoreductase